MKTSTTSGPQYTAPQSGRAGPNRDVRNELEGDIPSDSDEKDEVNPVGMVDGLTRSHDGQTAHPGSNPDPDGPGGARQDVGGDVNSAQLEAHKFVPGVTAAEPVITSKKRFE